MDDKHSKKEWWKRWDLDERGRCKHVKDILKDAEPIGIIGIDKDSHLPSRWEIFRCKTCGYIYCGRLPLKYLLKMEKKYCDLEYDKKLEKERQKINW